jgi:hypothetical protein
MVKISIAMTTYNGARHIREQLDSFATQTLLPNELVVTDDGSSDKTLTILEQFSESAPFTVRVVKNDVNLGFTKNFNKALSLCSGDIVLLSDQDDLWFSNKINRIAEIMADDPNCWVLVHDGRIVDETLVWSGVTKMSQIRSGYGGDATPDTGALTAIRRVFLSMALPVPDAVVGHDIWLHTLCRAFEGHRTVLDDCLQLIRRHTSNTSEWVVNSRHKIGRFDVLRSQFRTQPAVDYGDRIALNAGLQNRLPDLLETRPELRQSASPEAFLAQLERESEALAARQKLAQAGAVSRKGRALAMLMRGQYAHFNGLRSFLRDITR